MPTQATPNPAHGSVRLGVGNLLGFGKITVTESATFTTQVVQHTKCKTTSLVQLEAANADGATLLCTAANKVFAASSAGYFTVTSVSADTRTAANGGALLTLAAELFYWIWEPSENA